MDEKNVQIQRSVLKSNGVRVGDWNYKTSYKTEEPWKHYDKWSKWDTEDKRALPRGVSNGSTDRRRTEAHHGPRTAGSVTAAVWVWRAERVLKMDSGDGGMHRECI